MHDERELLERWQGGDSEAGSTLFRRYYAPIDRFFRAKIRDGAAPDLVQTAFLACVEGRGRLREGADFRAYLFAVAHNLLRKHYRSKGRRGAPEDVDVAELVEPAPPIGELLIAEQERRLLREQLDRIPRECQVALDLFYWEQRSTREIGEVTAVPEGTVKSRIQRGRRLLGEGFRRAARPKAARRLWLAAA